MSLSSLRRRLVLIACAVLPLACNALVGFGALEKVDNADSESEGGGSSSGSSGGGDGSSPIDQDGGTSSSGGEAGPRPPRCTLSQPFGAPETVTEFDGSQNTGRARLSADELDAFYTMGPSATRVLRHAHRTTIDSPWTIQTLTLSPPASAVLATTVNGLRLYYYTASAGTFTLATRPDRNTPFGAGKTLNEPATVEFLPFIVEADDVAYYDRPKGTPGTEVEIVKAPLLISGISNGGEQVIGGIDHLGMDDWAPILTANELAMYYSVGPDSPTVQQWVVRRTNKGAQFANPIRVPELEDIANDHLSWVSDDECIVYMTRSAHVARAKRPL